MKHSPIFFLLLFSLILIVGEACSFEGSPSGNQSQPDTSKTIDRDYTLEATMLGYTGIGGSIDGIRNPVLRANRGDSVRITIINGESLLHDIAMEQMGLVSDQINVEGDSTSISFRAEKSDTYFCTIPGHRQAGMEGKFEVTDEEINEGDTEENIVGKVPQKNGRTLNLDFETGTLEDWTVDGDGSGFDNDPITGNPSPMHEDEMTIDHRGEYFFSSGGTEDYEATDTLTSVSFEVTEPFAAFFVSGGALQDTRVELVDAETDEVFFKITGNNHARLRPVVVNLEQLLEQEIYIRIIDNETGVTPIPYVKEDVWAHINFDDFRFYPERPEFSNELDPEEIKILPARDPIYNAGLSAEEAVEEMELPDGFSVNLAASEPDVIRPIGFAIDDQGRLWVAEGHTYPEKAPEGEGKDRVLIFEDTNGDGELDSRKVFMEGLNLVSGIEVGYGGVWIGAAPELLYIPIDNATDKPAGEPEVLLDGWGMDDTHETLNSFQWGPDGWLYGVQGVFTHSNVGKPGVSDEERQKINAGVWRYHPIKKEFEIYSEGTSNPWGIDFNDYGHPFITVCVISHLHHAIQGGRFERQAGEHFNPHTYDDINAIGDHVHWVGDSGPHAGNYRSNSVGGGHAHVGAMFYLGNDHWERDRNSIFMNNIHGNRVNVDHLEREGSGYTGTHGEDFLKTNDAWSQWLNFRIGPGGSVYVIDWYDKNRCHSPNPDVHETSMGRIYKISHDKDQWTQTNLSEKTNEELVELQLHENDWYVRQARKILHERGPDSEVHKALKEMFDEQSDVTRKLRALWALHVTEGLSDDELLELLDHDSEYVRGWTVQLLAENKNVSDNAAEKFAQMAHKDSSANVRLYLASALQRMDLDQRWDILEGLLGRKEDAEDRNIPLMVWYAAEPLAEEDMERVMGLALETEFPNILSYTIRRIGVIDTQQSRQLLREIEDRLGDMSHPQQSEDVQTAIGQVLEGK